MRAFAFLFPFCGWLRHRLSTSLVSLGDTFEYSGHLDSVSLPRRKNTWLTGLSSSVTTQRVLGPRRVTPCHLSPVRNDRKAETRGFWSGRRASNPRPTAWKAVALPTELLPQGTCRTLGTRRSLISPPGAQQESDTSDLLQSECTRDRSLLPPGRRLDRVENGSLLAYVNLLYNDLSRFYK